MPIVGMKEMQRIFRLIDEMGIHREKIEVPLSPEGDGSVRMLPSGKAEIVLPENKPLEEWIPHLKAELDKLPIPREKVEY